MKKQNIFYTIIAIALVSLIASYFWIQSSDSKNDSTETKNSSTNVEKKEIKKEELDKDLSKDDESNNNVSKNEESNNNVSKNKESNNNDSSTNDELEKFAEFYKTLNSSSENGSYKFINKIKNPNQELCQKDSNEKAFANPEVILQHGHSDIYKLVDVKDVVSLNSCIEGGSDKAFSLNSSFEENKEDIKKIAGFHGMGTRNQGENLYQKGNVYIWNDSKTSDDFSKKVLNYFDQNGYKLVLNSIPFKKSDQKDQDNDLKFTRKWQEEIKNGIKSKKLNLNWHKYSDQFKPSIVYMADIYKLKEKGSFTYFYINVGIKIYEEYIYKKSLVKIPTNKINDFNVDDFDWIKLNDEGYYQIIEGTYQSDIKPFWNAVRKYLK